jgi:iron complex outermembrane receptor protein
MGKILRFACMSIGLMLLTATVSRAQSGSVRGTVVDNETDETVVGASVLLKGTSTGVTTGADGKFTLEGVPAGSATITISFIGYSSKEVTVTVTADKAANAGTIRLASEAIGLDEISIVASIGIDRKTPVALSTVRAEVIETKLGNQEFPEILQTTPGVYVNKAGGGYGDSQITIRGFESTNVGVLINGIPVNDMENGTVYWSNWVGLANAAGTVQVQRGLGASKVAIPSVGGTINVISKASAAQRGGSVFYGVGNNNYQKQTLALNTGLSEKGFALSLSLGQTKGDGYADGTQFNGYEYYVNIAKKFNTRHEITFTALGAQQRHGQRQNRSLISTIQDNKRGIRYNPDWGYKNGKVVWAEDNFYTKPLFSLNHYWTINETTELSTVAYASFGTGGGGGTTGETALFNANRTDGAIDFDAIMELNKAAGAAGSRAILRASRNDHKWYGALSTLNKQVSANLNILGGLDFRYYYGEHFTELTDLLDGEHYLDKTNKNNPMHYAKEGDKILYNNDNVVLWEGAFVQGEYTMDKLTTFITLQGSNTSYKRIDYFNYLDSDANQETPYYNFFGWGAKGGANYNLTDNHNVFANIGYFERAPFVDAVFRNFRNDVNKNAEPEKITSFELGYGYRSGILTANANVYYTRWADKFFAQNVAPAVPGTPALTANILGVNAIHKGLEIDLKATPTSNLTLNGMLSVGDWRWQNNLTDVPVFNDQQVQVATVNLYIKDTHVGGSAQTTAALGARYELFNDFNLAVDYTYFANNYAYYDALTRSNESYSGKDPWKMPDFGLVDLNATYKFAISEGVNGTLSGNVYNLFDTDNIKNANDGSNSDWNTALVYYGFGRTWSLGLKINF